VWCQSMGQNFLCFRYHPRGHSSQWAWYWSPYHRHSADRYKELEVILLEYDTLKKGAAKYLGLREAHEKISSELPKLCAELEKAQKAYDKLQSSARMRWFVYGAGVMTLGWIGGHIMGGWRRRRSSKVYR
jgi:hypothetical protein